MVHFLSSLAARTQLLKPYVRVLNIKCGSRPGFYAPYLLLALSSSHHSLNDGPPHVSIGPPPHSKVTNHRMDSVSFKFTIEPTSSIYSTRRPNFNLPMGREVKLHLEPRQTVAITEVEKLDLTREFQP